MITSSPQKVIYRYSEAFKPKVVTEIEKGKLTTTEAVRLYEITGGCTIYNWLRKYGKDHLIHKVVRIEMKDEKTVLKKQKERIRELESALSSMALHNICLQSYIDVVNENISNEEKKFTFQAVPRAASSVATNNIGVSKSAGVLEHLRQAFSGHILMPLTEYAAWTPHSIYAGVLQALKVPETKITELCRLIPSEAKTLCDAILISVDFSCLSSEDQVWSLAIQIGDTLIDTFAAERASKHHYALIPKAMSVPMVIAHEGKVRCQYDAYGENKTGIICLSLGS